MWRGKPWLVFISERMLSLLVVQHVISAKCCFVYGFICARLQTGGWEMVASTNTHSFNPPYSPSLPTPTCFSPSRRTALCPRSPHSSSLNGCTRENSLSQSSAADKCPQSWQFLVYWFFSLSSLPPFSFFMHITTLSLWSLSVAGGQHFLSQAASAQQSAYTRVKS